MKDFINCVKIRGGFVDSAFENCHGDEFPVPDIRMLPSVGGDGSLYWQSVQHVSSQCCFCFVFCMKTLVCFLKE